MKASTYTPTVAPETPWLGLQSFSKDSSSYFFGRDAELNDLYERVVRKPLTTLYGQSGLGKTSLLQAALIPKLEEGGLLPVFLRLNFSEESKPLSRQLLDALADAMESGGCSDFGKALRESPVTLEPADIWLLFHDPVHGLAERMEKIRPIVIFDQFEEIFTLGGREDFQEMSLEFRDLLASFVENRPPDSLIERLEAAPDLAERINYSALPIHFLLTLREDYLHLLERWRREIPSLMNNRLELRLLSGPQAFEAVVRPGQLRSDGNLPIIPDSVGTAVVRFVAGVEEDVPLQAIDAVPPLLSLVCAELNSQRIAENAEQITRADFEGKSSEILNQFYSRSFDPSTYGRRTEDHEGFADALIRLQTLVEGRLLSAEGFRESLAYDTILRELQEVSNPDTSSAVLNAVVARRLLSSDERGGVQRVELTHDVLTSVVKANRDERLEREAVKAAESKQLKAEEEARRAQRQKNRLRGWVVISSVVSVLAIATALFAFHFFREARKSEKQAQKAEEIAQESEAQAQASKDEARKNFDLVIDAIETLYDEAISSIHNSPGSTLESALPIKRSLRDATLTRLAGIRSNEYSHKSAKELIAHIHLDEYTDSTFKRDWKTAAASSSAALKTINSMEDQGQLRNELLSHVYFSQTILDYFTNDKSFVVGKLNMAKLNKLRDKFPKSWKIQYWCLRNENALIIDVNLKDEFIRISNSLDELLIPSQGDFDVALWAFVSHQNAFYSEEIWKAMKIDELEDHLSKFPDPKNYNTIEVEMAAKWLENTLTRTLKRLSINSDGDSLERKANVLKLADQLLVDLEDMLPSSIYVLERRDEYLDLESLCMANGVHWRDNESLIVAKSKFMTRAAEFGLSDAVRDRIAKTAGVSNNSSNKEDIDKLVNNPEVVYDLKRASGRAKYYTLGQFSGLFESGPLRTILSNLELVDKDNGAKAVATQLFESYKTAFASADTFRKNLELSTFCSVTENAVKILFEREKYSEVTNFWEDSFSNLQLETESNNSRDSVVNHAKYAAQAYVLSDDLESALIIDKEITAMSDRILKNRPWDWYLRQAIHGFYFDVGKILHERGYQNEAQPLLKKGWASFSYRTGIDLNPERNEWPLKGMIPDDATKQETTLFSRLLPKDDKRRTGKMKMFVIPCDVNGKKVKVQFYITSGKRGYENIMEQFKWISFYRGVKPPDDVRSSLKKLSDIANENNVDFLDLCTYALNYPTDDKKSESKKTDGETEKEESKKEDKSE